MESCYIDCYQNRASFWEFLGAYVEFSHHLYLSIIGIALLVGIRFLFHRIQQKNPESKYSSAFWLFFVPLIGWLVLTIPILYAMSPYMERFSIWTILPFGIFVLVVLFGIGEIIRQFFENRASKGLILFATLQSALLTIYLWLYIFTSLGGGTIGILALAGMAMAPLMVYYIFSRMYVSPKTLNYTI